MPKRSRTNRVDLNLLAKSIIDKATSEELVEKATQKDKNIAAVFLGHFGGLKGGKARAANLSAKKRSEIAKKAAKARWTKKTT